MINDSRWNDKTTRKDFYTNEAGMTYPSSHYSFDIDTYLVEHPDIEPAHNNVSKIIKTHVIEQLSGWYATCKGDPIEGALE